MRLARPLILRFSLGVLVGGLPTVGWRLIDRQPSPLVDDGMDRLEMGYDGAANRGRLAAC